MKYMNKVKKKNTYKNLFLNKLKKNKLKVNLFECYSKTSKGDVNLVSSKSLFNQCLSSFRTRRVKQRYFYFRRHNEL